MFSKCLQDTRIFLRYKRISITLGSVIARIIWILQRVSCPILLFGYIVLVLNICGFIFTYLLHLRSSTKKMIKKEDSLLAKMKFLVQKSCLFSFFFFFRYPKGVFVFFFKMFFTICFVSGNVMETF